MLDLMMGMKALQRPVIELLLDMMLDLCDRLPTPTHPPSLHPLPQLPTPPTRSHTALRGVPCPLSVAWPLSSLLSPLHLYTGRSFCILAHTWHDHWEACGVCQLSGDGLMVMAQ